MQHPVVPLSERASFAFPAAYLDLWRDYDVPMSTTGLVTLLRTYAGTKEDGTLETWFDVCRRVVEGAFSIYRYHVQKHGLRPDTEFETKWSRKMFESMMRLEWCPAGRGLQHMGHDRMWERGGAVLNSCAFISTADDRVADWLYFLADMSMLGVGVGFDTRGAGMRLYRPSYEFRQTLTVEDTREGWAEAIRRAMAPYLMGGPMGISTWDFSEVRPAGAPLRTMGGIASGPQPLVDAIQLILQTLDPHIRFEWDEDDLRLHVLDPEEGTPFADRLTAEQILDIGNAVGRCVVSGGIRRSAEICLFDSRPACEEVAFTAKQDNEKLMSHRWASNNSVIVTEPKPLDFFRRVVESCSTFGDPGLFFPLHAFMQGRAGEHNDREILAVGTNPCVTGDTLVSTTEGLRRVSDLVGQQFSFEHDGITWQSTVQGFWKTKEVTDLVDVRFADGSVVRCTEDHLFPVGGVGVIPASQITEGMEVPTHTTGESRWLFPEASLDHVRRGWLAGNFFGDGHMLTSENRPACLEYWGPAKDVYPQVVSEWLGDARVYDIASRDKVTVVSQTLDDALCSAYGLNVDKRLCPSRITDKSAQEQLAFVLGWLEADGSFQGVPNKGLSIRLTSTDLSALLLAKGILSSWGVYAKVYSGRKPAGTRDILGSSYEVQEVHELVVSAASRRRLAQLLLAACREYGLPTRYTEKASEFQWAGAYRDKERAKVVGVTPVVCDAPVSVYDCSVPGLNYFPANGVMVHNCGEQLLEDGEVCNLVETVPGRGNHAMSSACAFIYGKFVSLLPIHHPKARAVVARNRRIGVSLTGWTQFAYPSEGARTPEFLKEYLDQSYHAIRMTDMWLCKKYLPGVPTSIKTTSVKPSGSVSLVLGTSPGMNAHFAPHYIRRINIENSSPLLELLREDGYPSEPNIYSPTSHVVEFPCEAASRTDFTAIQQLETVKLLQHHWSDNMVSNTIVFDDHEVDEIAQWVYDNQHWLRSLSFLRRQHGFAQPPLEAITEEEYVRRVQNVLPVDPRVYARAGARAHDAGSEDKWCDGGRCEMPGLRETGDA